MLLLFDSNGTVHSSARMEILAVSEVPLASSMEAIMSWKAKRFYDTKKESTRVPLSKHHRKPKALGGRSNESNISELPVSKHRAWHTLFRDFDPYRIAQEINSRYLDPGYEMVVKRISP